MKPHRHDPMIATLVFVLTFFVFTYFFQGDGWSAQSAWLTTRAIVERGSFDITQDRARTNDVSIVHDRVYSNKPPGLPLVGVVPYWLTYHVERSPLDETIEWRNMWAITAFSCALPGAVLTAMIYLALRRDGATQRLAAAMAIAFAFGSIVWPYTGMLFNHVLVTACFFIAWLLTRRAKLPALFTASFVLGIAMISEYMIAPLALALIAFDAFEHRDRRRTAVLSVGVLLAIVALMIYQHQIFGSAFAPSYKFERRPIKPGDFLAGRFGWPDVRRIYWITFHRFRGLFYCCPVFIAALLAMPLFKPISMKRETKFAMFVIAYHFMLLLTYTFWAGGNGVGPRFAMPALPFLFVLSRRGFEKFPFIAWPLALLSIFEMLAVTSVEALYPGNEAGSPLAWDPIGVCVRMLFSNQLAVLPHASNLGLELGMHGVWSLAPVVLLIAFSLAACAIRFRSKRTL